MYLSKKAHHAATGWATKYIGQHVEVIDKYDDFAILERSVAVTKDGELVVVMPLWHNPKHGILSSVNDLRTLEVEDVESV